MAKNWSAALAAVNENISDEEAARKYKRERTWWEVAAVVGFLLLAFFFHPSSEEWIGVFGLVFFWFTSHYFGYQFATINRKLKRIESNDSVDPGQMKQVMNSIEYKLDAVADAQAVSGEVKQVMTTLRSVEHKLDILLAN